MTRSNEEALKRTIRRHQLREMVPRVRDQELYADLAHMLSSHVANISLTNAAIG